VDIGSSLIKVVEARPGKGGVEIAALGVGPTPPGAVENDIVVDPQALGHAIRQLLAESGIKCKRCVSAVSGQSSVVVRIIEVPKMTKQELGETMKWEIERHVPFSANEILMDFQPIERPGAAPDDQSMEVLLAVAQQEVVNTHVDALFAAGLDPVAIDVEPLAVCRSLIDLSGDGEGAQTVAVINIGAETTDLGVFREGILAFPRTVPLAGDAVTRAISDTLNIPIEQAERLKRERAVVHLDRMAAYSHGVEPAGGGFGNMGGDATMGLNAMPEEPEPDYSNMGFIPGLGFTPNDEPEASVPSAGPEFDVDLGMPSAGPGHPMAFDLSDVGGEPEPPTAPRPAFELTDVGTALEPEQPSELSGLPVQSEEAVSDDAVFDAVAPVLADLVAEIRRSLDYFVSRYQSQPDRILLCGGTAKLPNLDRYFESELGIPVSIANPLRNAVVISRSMSEDYLEEVSAIFPVSVGLAVRDIIGE
jgi:type IV pilus assembly protein PilM